MEVDVVDALREDVSYTRRDISALAMRSIGCCSKEGYRSEYKCKGDYRDIFGSELQSCNHCAMRLTRLLVSGDQQ